MEAVGGARRLMGPSASVTLAAVASERAHCQSYSHHLDLHQHPNQLNQPNQQQQQQQRGRPRHWPQHKLDPDPTRTAATTRRLAEASGRQVSMLTSWQTPPRRRRRRGRRWAPGAGLNAIDQRPGGGLTSCPFGKLLLLLACLALALAAGQAAQDSQAPSTRRVSDLSNMQALPAVSNSSSAPPQEPPVGQIPRQKLVSKRAPAPAPAPAPHPAPHLAPASLKQQQQQQQLALSRISEADLLPLSDFTVEQPAFSDIMKLWPPTTTKQLHMSKSEGAARGPGHRQHQHPSQRHHQHQPAHQHGHFGPRAPSGPPSAAPGPSLFERLTFQRGGGAGEEPNLVRNHLNEDFDDSIVTADESFEQDQLAEPPTWVNYLGELGDFIYLLLGQFYEPGAPRSPFRAGQQQQQQAASSSSNKSQAPARFLEPIEDLLDDFYYDQYENNQVLYYGPQLVREGDIFEIGCYLPNEQPAEWTKSGKLLASSEALPLSSTGGSTNGAGATSAAHNQSTAATLYALNVQNNPLRVIKRSQFMGAKQNYSLKVFEAQLSDTGNYRCSRLSRKYHKLIVVPAKSSAQQLYLIQQRLLAVVAPNRPNNGALSAQQIQLATLQASLRALGQPLASGGSRLTGAAAAGAPNSRPTIQASGESQDRSSSSASQRARQSFSSGSGSSSSSSATNSRALSSIGQLLPGSLLVEEEPLTISCPIGDEFVLRRLRENPQFQLSWYKNGKLMRHAPPINPISVGDNSSSSQTYYTSSTMASGRQQQQQQRPQQLPPLRVPDSPRIHLKGANGRQLHFQAAFYTDAGDYLCSWSRLPARQADESEDQDDTSSTSAQQAHQQQQQLNSNPLAAGSLHQLVVPVKLRPFKSAYHVRQNNQLRLVCQVQRGYPGAQISWHVGNQLVDADFLRANPEFQVLQLEAPRSLASSRQFQLRASAAPASDAASESSSAGGDANLEEPQIVEINPIPASRQQMQLTVNGRGQWIEYRKLSNDKFAIDTADNQMRYLQMKLAQLTNANLVPGSEHLVFNGGVVGGSPTQASLSVLVVNKLERDKHTSRYACRATSRANTDEVTTVIRVEELATMVTRPNRGAATLVPGQPLHFECAQIGRQHAEFKWYKRPLQAPGASSNENAGAGQTDADNESQLAGRILLEPNTDDSFEIHNERLTLVKPNYDSVGDYICQALSDEKTELPREFATIKVRTAPHIEDFGLSSLSHTGKSATVIDGDRIVLTCRVRDQSVPVNLTWLRSELSDDERQMVPLPEVDGQQSQSHEPQWRPASTARLEEPTSGGGGGGLFDAAVPTYTSTNNVIVERVDNFTKRLVIESAGLEHRGHYVCLADNGVTERSRKAVFIRVKDKIIALWPFLGILAELFILFTIIYFWETQRAQKALASGPSTAKGGAGAAATPATGHPGKGPGGGYQQRQQASTSKRLASGPTSAFESVPLNR